MIQDLFDSPQVWRLRAGQVAEFHIVPDDASNAGEITSIGNRSVFEFIDDWGYALLDRRWNEAVYGEELPEPDTKAKYVGVVHEDGAFLVALDSVGAAS